MCLKNGEWRGINTDVAGITKLIETAGIQMNGARVTILGAGGAARAAAYVARRAGSSIHFLNRTLSKANALAEEFGGKFGTLSEFGRHQYDILIQATSSGMQKEDCPVNPDLLQVGSTVIDAIYEPEETLLLKKAKAAGCRVVNGRLWFDAQAEAQFAWWKANLLSAVSDKQERD
jgi:shikimate 5-dehydrogenase